MTDCEQIRFAEAAESAELRYILSEMAKYPACDFLENIMQKKCLVNFRFEQFLT